MVVGDEVDEKYEFCFGHVYELLEGTIGVMNSNRIGRHSGVAMKEQFQESGMWEPATRKRQMGSLQDEAPLQTCRTG